MITLITGGSGSGKSAYAEDYLIRHTEGGSRFYLATMQVYGEEGRARVERHRRLRSGKGFFTIEQPVDIAEAVIKIVGCTVKPEESGTALLECMSNLVANEMFSGEMPKSCDCVTEKVVREVEQLSGHLEHLVIVTNNVFEDGAVYEETTMEYMRALGSINGRLAELADTVIEVVVGIPLVLKDTEKGKYGQTGAEQSRHEK